MSESLDPQYKEVICPAITEKAQEGVVKLQDVLNIIEDYIVRVNEPQMPLRAFRGNWTKRISDCAALLNIKLIKEDVTWDAIERRLQQRSDEANETTDTPSKSSSTTTTTNSSSVKIPLTAEDKEVIRKTYVSLDPAKCWILDATKQLATARGEEPQSVESKMMTFALSCNYAHPSHSMILDLNDEHWRDVFTEAEIAELFDYGKPLTRPLPTELTDQFDAMSKLKNAMDAYKFAQHLDHDPITQPLLAWLYLSVAASSYRFLRPNSDDMTTHLESDKIYRQWGFISDIFDGSRIAALGKERGSIAHGNAINKGRRISGADPIHNRKHAKRMDCIYVAGAFELGCLEIGGHSNDQTKAYADGMIKIPIVLKDMLIDISTRSNASLNELVLIGYNISGESVAMLQMDVPSGYVCRIRRLREMLYPSSVTNYVPYMLGLLKLAAMGKEIMEHTLAAIDKVQQDVYADDPIAKPVLPPCFHPQSSTSTSSSSSRSSKPSKRQKTQQ